MLCLPTWQGLAQKNLICPKRRLGFQRNWLTGRGGPCRGGGGCSHIEDDVKSACSRSKCVGAEREPGGPTN
jgi:hypothetical protein